jgi:hypothetical protein
MKKKTTIALLLGAIGAAAITAYLIHRANTTRMLSQVSDEGYETAPDILFPDKTVSSKLRFGPVLPQ